MMGTKSDPTLITKRKAIVKETNKEFTNGLKYVKNWVGTQFNGIKSVFITPTIKIAMDLVFSGSIKCNADKQIEIPVGIDVAEFGCGFTAAVRPGTERLPPFD